MSNQNTDVIQGTLDMLILKTLSLEPMHGFGIARRVEQISRGVFKVNPGSLLTALQRLERAGWLDSEWRQTENSRRAKFYTLTRAGKKQLEIETTDWTRRASAIATAAPRRGLSSMSLLRQLTHGLRGLLCRAQKNQDIDEEVQHYFEEATAAWRTRGLSAEDAKQAARLELGNMTVVEEQVRSYGWENAVRTFFYDLHFASRQLRNNPGFTIVSILTLALGIGASTAIFSAVDPIVFEPLPYPHSDRIMMIWPTYKGARFEAAFGTYLELQQRSRSFDSMAIFEPWQPALTADTQPERLEGQSVSASFFRVLGVTPSVGRDFRASEDTFHGPKVVILSDQLWRQQFHRDSAILGRQIKLSDNNYTVIGVMPPGFHDVLSPSAELWTTEQYDTSQIATKFNTWEWGDHLRIVARLGQASIGCRPSRSSIRSVGIRGHSFRDRAGLLFGKASSSSPFKRTLPTLSNPLCWRSSAQLSSSWQSPASTSPIWCWHAAHRGAENSQFAAPSVHRSSASPGN